MSNISYPTDVELRVESIHICKIVNRKLQLVYPPHEAGVYKLCIIQSLSDFKCILGPADKVHVSSAKLERTFSCLYIAASLGRHLHVLAKRLGAN